jgi:hypothetical protein
MLIVLSVGVLSFPVYAAPLPSSEPIAIVPIEGQLNEPVTAEPLRDPRETYIPPPGAFTPDGSATVVDNFLEGTKEFFTFSTPDGNVFYLVIDRLRDQENVYFLNAVTEADLMALAQKSGKEISVSAIPEPMPTSPPAAQGNEPPVQAPPSNAKNNSTLFIIIGAAVFGIAGYYFKIVKPKNRAAELDAEEEYQDEPEERPSRANENNDAADDDGYGDYEDD